MRPIPRGKDKAATEFGAKISASEVDGMSGIEHINWNNFNESTDLILQTDNIQNYLWVLPRITFGRPNLPQ